jgi:hypothetical protein
MPRNATPSESSQPLHDWLDLEQCSKDPIVRALCVRRILDKMPDMQLCRTLHTASASHRTNDCPVPPQPFSDVAAVILNDARDRIDGVVLHSGKAQRIARPIMLPADVAAAHTGAGKRSGFSEQAIEDEILRSALDTFSTSPPSAATKTQASLSEQLATPPPMPASLEVQLDKPLVGGRLPVLTPATPSDAKALQAEVQSAEVFPSKSETTLKQEIASYRDQPPAEYVQHMVQTEGERIPIMSGKQTRQAQT